MPTPSLILVPARFKTGKLYTPLATTTGALELGASGDFNVTRATTATRVNASGLIESVASGIPRLDYYTSGGVTGCPALLIEPAATNLLSGSSDFGNTTYWTRPAGANVTGNVAGITAPDGTNTAALFQASGTTATNSRLRQTISRTTTGSHAFSVFIKGFAGVAASGSLYTDVGLIELSFAITSGGVVSLTSMTGAGAVTSGITQFPNGWYRITAVGTAATSGSTQNEIYCSPSGSQYYCWGAQLETGSVATSYIPTTTAAVTRNADVISVSGAVSGCIGQTEGTFYVEFQASPSGSTSNWLNISDNTTNNWLFIGKDGINTRLYLRANNVVIFSNETTPLTGGVVKAAIGYKSGDYAAYINGNLIVSGTTAFSFSSSLNRIHNGSNIAEPSLQISRYRSAALYTTRLTNSQLQALTTL